MMKEVKMGAYIRGAETLDFNFYTDLSAANKLKFVNSVVDILIDDEHYNSVIRDLVFDFYVIDIFTDVDTTELEDSLTFLDDVEQFLEETNIVEIVKANAYPTLFDELNKAIDDSIQYRTGIHPNPLNEALAALVSALEKKVNEVDLNSMMSMAQKFANMTGDLTVDNVVKAYMDSVFHKNNLEEIAESKKDKKSKKNEKNEIKIDENLGEAIRAVVKEDKAESTEM